LRAAFFLVMFAVALLVMAQGARGQIELVTAENPFRPILRMQTQYYQVRIDQRVIVRLPVPSAAAAAAGTARKSSAVPVRYKEEKIGKCLWIDKLAGSRVGTKQSLELMTKDGVLIRAYLGDGCLAREFYAGAYMERPYDGKLCVERDLLHARTGAKCEVDRFRLLVPR
jgi:hypothetical protein